MHRKNYNLSSNFISLLLIINICLEQYWRTHFPKEKSGTTKYGENGIYHKKNFDSKNIPNSLKPILARSANHAVAKHTWLSYKTAHNMLEKCEFETGADLSFPLDEDKTLIFVGWCIERGLKGQTIKSYISGLKSFHISKGFGSIDLLTPMVKQVIAGRLNMPEKRVKVKRLPCTINILKLLKAKLRLSKLSVGVQLLVWAVSSLAFYGAFRCGELLSKYSLQFDKKFTLLKKDISIHQSKEIDMK